MYWQIAAGSEGRDYSEFFLKYGMAFVGGDNNTRRMKKVNVGDVVVLKQGRSKILAAGRVIPKNGIHRGEGDKEWLRDFDGWDLKAYCYVDWKKPNQPVPTGGLTMGTIKRLNQNEPQKAANSILKTGEGVKVEKEPDEETTVTDVKDNQLLEFLIKEGLRVSSAGDLTDTISKIRLLAKYYWHHCNWKDIREHETRTFLVIPLLLALGWSEQQLKIELPRKGGKIDIACFRKNYGRDLNVNECVAIIETKGFSSGLDYAHNQAMAYATNFPNSKAVVLTNGYCYKIYLRDADDKFQTTPSAYINLLKQKDKYPLNPIDNSGALHAIKWLLPNSLI